MRSLSKVVSAPLLCWLLASVTGSSAAQADLGSVSLGKKANIVANVVFAAPGTIDSIEVVTGGAANADFTDAGTGTCKTGATYSEGQTCSVAVSFGPRSPGLIEGAIVLRSSTQILATLFLRGTGSGPQLSFSPSKAVAFDPPLVGRGGSVGLADPSAVAVDGSGTIYVNSATFDGVAVIPPNGATPYILDPVVDGPPVGNVYSVAVDGAGDLFLAEGFRVLEVRPDGSAAEFYSPYTLAPNFTAVATDASGNLYLGSNTDTIKLLEYVGANNQIDPVPINIDPQTNLALNGINQIAIDPAGNLFLTGGSGALFKLTAAQVAAGGGAGTRLSPTLEGHSLLFEGVAFDGTGSLYTPISSSETPAFNGKILVLPVAGGTPYTIAPMVDVKPLGGVGLAFDRAGDLVVADDLNQRVVEVERTLVPPVHFADTSKGNKSSDSPQAVQVINTGNMPLTFTEVSFPADFPKDSASSSCSTSTPLQGGQTCPIPIDFIPTSLGTIQENVALEDNTLNVNGTPQLISVSGTGLDALLSAYSLSFGSVETGKQSASQKVTLTNTTGRLLHISSIAVTGVNRTSFVFATDCPTTLVGGATCTIHGHLQPSTAGELTAAVTVADDAPKSPQTITLTGAGDAHPVLVYTPTSLSFGNLPVGVESPSQQVTISNTGESPLPIVGITVVGDNPSAFVFGSTCPSSLAAGASCNFHGHFAPSKAGGVTANISLRTGDPSATHLIQLSGTGTLTSPTVAMSTTGLAFGTQSVGTISWSQSVSLTNTGTSTLYISGIKVTGANASAFVFGSFCGGTLAPGAVCSVHGHFAPTGKGMQTATISIVDNAGSSPQLISLTGTGN